MSLQYHDVQPESVKASYGEFDNVDFVLTFENRKLVNNSVRILADLRVLKNNANIADSDLIFLDSMVGAHSFVQSVQTETQAVGVIENLQEYPRYVRMAADTAMTVNGTMNSEMTCEMRSPNQLYSQKELQGVTTVVGAANVDNDFSVKPLVCLNAMSDNLSYTKTGAVRVTIKLARIYSALFGSGVDGNVTYALKNLRLSFMSLPEDNNKKPVQLRTKLNIKQTVLSSFVNVASKVPAVCNAVSCSFQEQSNENTAVKNNYNTAVLPNVTQLQFMFNDSTNSYVSYQIKNQPELLDRYIQSFRQTGLNNASLDNLKANSGFGVGLAFDDFVNLSNQKFNVQITSGVKSTNPYIIYLYFHSLISI